MGIDAEKGTGTQVTAAEEANARRLLWLIIGGVMLMLLASCGFIYVQWREIENTRSETRRHELAALQSSRLADVRTLEARARLKESHGKPGQALALFRAMVAMSEGVSGPPGDPLSEAPTALQGYEERSVGGQILGWIGCFSTDWTLMATATGDGSVGLRDVHTGLDVGILKPEGALPWKPQSLVFSPDGRLLAAEDPHTVRLWDVASGHQLFAFELASGHERWSLSHHADTLRFSPDGRLLETGARWASGSSILGEHVGHRRLWDTRSGVEWAGPLDNGRASWFSPDGRFMATTSSWWSLYSAMGQDEASLQLTLWDTHERAELYTVSLGPGSHFVEMADGDTVYFSPDGQVMAVPVERDGGEGDEEEIEVVFLDVPTGRELHRVSGPDGRVRFSFSPDGARFAMWYQCLDGCPDQKIWDVRTGRLVQTLSLGVEVGASYGADTVEAGWRYVATHRKSGGLLIWDITTGAGVHALSAGGCDDETHSSTSVVFSPDGGVVAATSPGGVVRVMEVETGRVLQVLETEADVEEVRFSPDGKLLATTAPDEVSRLWRLNHTPESRAPAVPLFNPLASVFGSDHDDPWDLEDSTVSFSPDGSMLATPSVDGDVRLRDAASGRELHVLEDPDSHVIHTLFSPDGRRLATLSIDSAVRLWNMETLEAEHLLDGLEGIRGMSFSPDGALLVTPSSTGAGLWDVASGQGLHLLFHDWAWERPGYGKLGIWIEMSGGDLTISRVKPGSPADRAGLEAGDVVVQIRQDSTFHMTRREARARFRASPERPLTIGVTRAGAPEPLSLKITRDRFVNRGPAGPVHAAVFSPDGELLVTAGTGEYSRDHTPRVWNVTEGRVLRLLEGHEDDVTALAFSPDGKRLVSASADGTARIWHVDMGYEGQILRGHEGTVSSVAFSSDGRQVATASREDETTRIWDVDSGEQRYVFKGHNNWGRTISLSPDGRLLATIVDGKPHLWDWATGEELALPWGYLGSVKQLRFSPSGDRVVTGSWEGTARLWPLPDVREMARLDSLIHQTGDQTNYRVCRDSFELVPVLPFPPAGSIWAPETACRPTPTAPGLCHSPAAASPGARTLSHQSLQGDWSTCLIPPDV